MSNIDERRKKLLKLKTELGESDEEVREWHQWFIQQTEDFKKSKLGVRAYEIVLNQYEKLLNRKRDIVEPTSQVPTYQSEEESDISKKGVTPSLFCLKCAQKNPDSTQFCIYCGQEIPRRRKPKISTVKSLPDPVPIVEKDEAIKPEITLTEKADKEKTSKTIAEEEVESIDHSKKDIIKSPEKIESKISQKKEISRKPARKEVVSQIDVRKEPEKKPKRQYELADIVSFGRLTIAATGVFFIVLLFIIFAKPPDRYPIGMLVLAFLLLISGIIFDVLRWKNTDLSALGAVIFLIGIVMVFCLPLAYTIRFDEILISYGLEFLVLIWVVIASLFVVGGAGARWSDYDTKIVDMATMAAAYWNNYEKRAAIRKILEMIGIFLKGLAISISDGIKHFPRRVWTLLGRIKEGLKLYLFTNIRLTLQALNRFFHSLWRNVHWFGLLAIFAYLGLTGLSSYQNIGILIIVSFFFVLGILFSNSEKVVKAISNTRTTILMGAISAYSMLTGAKIKKEESIFCSRCLRGVHRIEFAELQEVEDTNNPLCPFCGFGSWVTTS